LTYLACLFAVYTSLFADTFGPLAKKSPVVHKSLNLYLERFPDSIRVPVWIFMTDKGIRNAEDYRQAIRAERETVTDRVLARRKKVVGEELVSHGDLPVNDFYIDALISAGLEKRRTSRWLNAVSGFIARDRIDKIASIPFVKEITLLRAGRRKPLPVSVSSPGEGVRLESWTLDYGRSADQLAQINVPAVHDLGYTGTGVLVCMLDTGFDLGHESLQHIRVAAEYDFIFDDETTSNEEEDVANQDCHGTEVLSVIGGARDGQLYGPAFNADFMLAKTEDIRSETPIEEDNWVAAIEWAERLGADVASSSLGYNDWYTYEDMDGNTAVTTRAADRAVARGMVVVTAAGNERSARPGVEPWYYIIAPADADSVIAVGAVNYKGMLASFSSVGPTFDGRIKPEVVARGAGVRCADTLSAIYYLNLSGTSFSTPLVSGTVALILEAHPNWTPSQVRDALLSTASLADQPDNEYGYGIIDALAAIHYRHRGDVDGDGVWGQRDVLLAADMLLQRVAYTEEAFAAADMDGNGILDILDIVKIVNLLSDSRY
jgi:serine protease AprX